MQQPKSVLRALLVLVVGAFLAGGALAQHEGGVLRYAITNDPPNLDVSMTTVNPTMQIAHHVFETLFAFDANWATHPFLVDTYQVSEDGTEIRFELREGVLFHDGQEMLAEDVVASLNRWLASGLRGRVLRVTDLQVTSPYGFVMKLEAPYAPLESVLAYAGGGPIIIPKEIAEAAGPEPLGLDQYIGTGPYRFVEWVPARVIRLARFDDYQPHPDEPSGYHGRRSAYLDEIHFIPVPDPSTRVFGVLAGDYDYAEYAPSDLYDDMVADPRAEVYLINPPRSLLIMFNNREGVMADQAMRQALLAALDMDPVIVAGYGSLGAVNGTIAAYVPGMVWYSDAGLELYDQNDVARAQSLARDAGYAGEPIRFMTTTTFQEFYNASLVAADQWQRAGFNVEVEVYDWATVSERRQNAGLWDIFITGGGPKPDPSLTDQMNPSYPGWWETDTRTELATAVNTEMDFAKRYELWEQYQALWYEEVPSINVGMAYQYAIAAPHVRGLESEIHPHFYWPYKWNVWLER